MSLFVVATATYTPFFFNFCCLLLRSVCQRSWLS